MTCNKFHFIGRETAELQDDTDIYLTSESQVKPKVEEHHQASDFYPAFSPFANPPLGHSRPFYYQQEGAYSQRPQSGYQQQQVAYDSPRYTGYKSDDGFRAASNSETHGLLGSGNFGVIRGGTFYDGDGESSSSNNYDKDEYNPYFGNGHGRPSFYFGGVPNPKPYQHEQFENFRDFADINTASNPAYSHYVVVYVNKNGTEQEVDKLSTDRPKNIIESLALLDLENSGAQEIVPPKLSKTKAKLALVPPEKKIRSKKVDKSLTKASREMSEPLLALS